MRKNARMILIGLSFSLMIAGFLFSSISSASTPGPDGTAKKSTDLKNDPASMPGVYFYRLEPSFYTGFAPRTQDPKRVTANLGRGNQLRVTVVLSDEIVDNYIADLATRYKVYSELIDEGVIKLSQNTGFEQFAATIQGERILQLAEKKSSMDPGKYREISLQKLQKLNPGKVFHIQIDFDQRIRNWSPQLQGIDKANLSSSDALDVVNDILPTRMKVSELSGEQKQKFLALTHLYDKYQKSQDASDWEQFYSAAAVFFRSLTGGIYPLHDKRLDYYEYTAIYPVGTLNEFAEFEGCEMPLYPCPGKRILKTHQRTHVVDHIPDKACYSYLPWIPYMHVGKTLHNSFHSLWFHIDTKTNSFIPDSWRKNMKDSRTGKVYPDLWLLSRGPMSHGCTHVNAGHISELRQLFPSDEESLREVVTYRNKSNHFDIFDIDGDGTPEVMGVKYFWAYSLNDKKPYKMRAPTDRKGFYKWLYKEGYHYDQQGRVIFEDAATSKFVGNKAVEGKNYQDIILYEADYSPETIQFYQNKPIDFVRELRRVSSTYDVNYKVLGLKKEVTAPKTASTGG